MSRYKYGKKLSEVRYSHSQAAIEALSSYFIDSNMIWECRNKLNEVGKKNEIFLIWVPSHSGINGKEEANTLAKGGTRMSFICPEPFCGIGKCSYRVRQNKQCSFDGLLEKNGATYEKVVYSV